MCRRFFFCFQKSPPFQTLAISPVFMSIKVKKYFWKCSIIQLTFSDTFGILIIENLDNHFIRTMKGGYIMDNRKIYYARVSSKDQNLARQIELFKSLGATDDQIITDKKSGKDFNREGYQSLKSAMGLRKGDTLGVKELDRLGRDKQGIKEELEYWKAKGVRVQVCDIPTTMQDFSEGNTWVQDMINNIIIEVYATMAEQERIKIKTRREEGMAAMPVNEDGKKYSLRTGKATGRPKTELPSEWDHYYNEWKSGHITARSCMQNLGLKKSTFYTIVKNYESEQNQK